MYETVKADIVSLENERKEVIFFFRRQVEAFENLKKTIDRVEWADSRYDDLVICLNQIGAVISDTLQRLTNGRDVYVLDELTVLLAQYVALANAFPQS